MLVIIGRNWGRLVLVIAALLVTVNLAEFALLSATKAVVATVSGRLVPVYFVATTEQKVAFTFEGAFGRDRTSDILRILKDHDIKATFFLSGQWIEKHPTTARAVFEDGHELGNYTYSVPHPNSVLAAELKRELEKAHKAIESISKEGPKAFRPPYGEYSNRVIETARELGYETVVWSIDSLDWRGAPASDVQKRILEKVHKGAIIRFHVTGANTAEALPPIIIQLKQQGFAIVPLKDLLLEGHYYIHPHTGEQRSIGAGKRRSGYDRRSPDEAQGETGSEA